MNITNSDYFTFNVHNSALIVGETGTGKTEFVRSLLRNYEKAYTPEQMKYVIFDLKLVEFATHRPDGSIDEDGAKEEYLYTPIRTGNPDDIEYLEQLASLAKNRAEDGITQPLIFIYIEECDLAAQFPTQFQEAVKTINRYAKAANMKLIFSTSRPSPDIIPEDLRDSFDLILSGKLASETDSEYLGVENGTELGLYEFAVVEKSPNEGRN